MGLSKTWVRVAVAVVFIGLIAVIVSQWQKLARLETENETLRTHSPDAEPAPNAEAQSPANTDDTRELARLRAEVTTLRRSTQELAQAQAEVNRLRAIAQFATNNVRGWDKLMMAHSMIAANTWTNAGNASPAATYQTLHWAKQNGHMDLLMNAVVLDDTARARVAEVLAALPETVRSQYASAEQLIADVIARTPPMTGLQVVEQQDMGTDNAKLKVRFQFNDGRIISENLEFQRYTDGWRQVIREDLATKMGAMFNERLRREQRKQLSAGSGVDATRE